MVEGEEIPPEVSFKIWDQSMPAIKLKGSTAFSPMLLAALLVGGGADASEVGGALSGTEEEGVSWDGGGGVGELEPGVGGMLDDVVGLEEVKLMPDGSLEKVAPVFLNPPELERFTPGGSLKLEFSFFWSLALVFIFFGGSSVLPLLSPVSGFFSVSGFVSASEVFASSAFSFFSSAGFSGFG